MIKLNIISPSQGNRTREFATQEELDAQVLEWAQTNHWGDGVLYSQENITQEVSLANEIDEKSDLGAYAEKACKKVLNYIAGSNLSKSLTIEQINQMQQTYSSAEAALRASRPTYAKYFISLIQPDGVLITDTEKTACLLILKDF